MLLIWSHCLRTIDVLGYLFCNDFILFCNDLWSNIYVLEELEACRQYITFPKSLKR